MRRETQSRKPPRYRDCTTTRASGAGTQGVRCLSGAKPGCFFQITVAERGPQTPIYGVAPLRRRGRSLLPGFNQLAVILSGMLTAGVFHFSKPLDQLWVGQLRSHLAERSTRVVIAILLFEDLGLSQIEARRLRSRLNPRLGCLQRHRKRVLVDKKTGDSNVRSLQFRIDVKHPLPSL